MGADRTPSDQHRQETAPPGGGGSSRDPNEGGRPARDPLGARGLIAAGVRNPVYANVLMVSILAGGLLVAQLLVSETYPEFSLDRITVTVVYPGAGPEEVEESICYKIDEALEGLAGVKRVFSRADEDRAFFVIELEEGVDSRVMILKIKDRLDQIDTFPPEMREPIISELLVRERVINVAIHGRVPERTLKNLAEEIRHELLNTSEVSQVQVIGVRDDEIKVEVSREALQRYGLSLNDVIASIARNSVDVPAGTLRTAGEELILRTTGERRTAREFADIVVIARPDGTLIHLGQIANVSEQFADAYKTGRFQGEPAAVLEVFKTPDQDTQSVARVVRDYVRRKQAELPAQIHLSTWADSSRQIEARIDMLLGNALFGMVLVLIVLSLFMGLRVALFVALGIPVSMAGALVVMFLTGQTLNMITLFGMIMVTGIIVDDAIVVADGFRARRAGGEPALVAAVTGPRDVVWPVLASSATTIVAFAPLWFVSGVMGKFIAVLPVVVVSAIVFSSIEVFCIFPAHLRHCVAAGAGRGGSRFGALRERVEAWVEGVIHHRYAPFLRGALRSRPITLAAAGGCLLLAAGWVMGGRVPFTLFPEIDGDALHARIMFPQGVPLERTMEAVRQVEAAARRLNDPGVVPHRGRGELVRTVFSLVGQWSGWSDEQGSHLCEVMIELMPAEQRCVDCQQILAAWGREVGVIDDALSVTFGRLHRGPTDKPLQFRLIGDDLDELAGLADEAVAVLKQFAGVSGVEHDLRPGKREVRITLKPLARTLGVTVDGLARELRSGFYGGEAVHVRRGREDVRVQVRYPESQRRSIADIENVRIPGPDGRSIPFRELADYRIERGYATIYHRNGRRAVRIQADVDERYANAETILRQLEKQFLIPLRARHPEVDYKIEGQHAQMLESMRSLMTAFVFALVVIYAILAAMLASYTQPLIIMAAIPLGFIGAVFGHALLGYPLTIMSVFGLVALSGVVVNDALVLLDRVRSNRRAGMPLFEAVVEAGCARFRAVLLTTVTTVAGLAPLMLERSTQAQPLIPMAISLVFGLMVATVLTLVVVPALVLGVEDLRGVLACVRGRPATRERGAPAGSLH